MLTIIPVKNMRKLFNEDILIYILCILSYVLLTRVVCQYYNETINDAYYKPGRILLYLLYTSELIFVFLFTPFFSLKKFTFVECQITKLRESNDRLNTMLNKKCFIEIIVKSFVLLSIFHIITLFSIRDNLYFSYQSFFVILFVLTVFLVFVVSYTSFLVLLTRNLCLSIAFFYFTIITVFCCLFFISTLIDIVDNPTPLINFTLNINPMLAISSVLNFSLYSLGPFHEATNFEAFDFTCPHWMTHVVSYFALSILFFIGIFLISTVYQKNIRNNKFA